MSASDQELLSTLVCPICSCYLSPPIQVCTNGHSLCPSCFKRVKSECPKCSGKFINRRCFILERIYEKLFIPCKYQKYGCTFAAKGRMIKKHEHKCFWRVMRKSRKKSIWILCKIEPIEPANKEKSN